MDINMIDDEFKPVEVMRIPKDQIREIDGETYIPLKEVDAAWKMADRIWRGRVRLIKEELSASNCDKLTGTHP